MYSQESAPVQPGYAGGGGGHGGGGFEGSGHQAPIHGYTGGGIPTDLFSQLTGRAPTAADVEFQNGGLSPQHPQMGNLDDLYRLNTGGANRPMIPGMNQMPAFPTGPAYTDPSLAITGDFSTPAKAADPQPLVPFTPGPTVDPKTGISFAADGGNIPAGNPVIVGERGPELMVPKKDVSVIPNEYMPQQHLMAGNILAYLKRFL